MQPRRSWLSVSLCIGLVIGCVGLREPDPVLESAFVERREGDRIAIRWEATGGSPSMRIYHSRDPETFDVGAEPLVVVEEGNAIEIPDPDPGTRPYFLLVPSAGQPLKVAERLLPLEGAGNFRDLGGYRTADGQSVKWGKLYRSDQLSGLTDDDLLYLDRLDLELVCDFRTPAQVERSGADRLPESATGVNLAIDAGRSLDEPMRKVMESGDASSFDPDALSAIYRELVADWTPTYGQMMERIADPDGRPAVIHCSHGKDRAGFGAAVLLWALGVPTETVIEDHLLTNEYRREEIEAKLEGLRGRLAGTSGRDPEQVDLSNLEPLYVLRRDNLLASADEIEQRYGSMEAYVREGLGLSDSDVAVLREALLEP